MWGTTIIKSLRFSPIQVNLLSAPGPILGAFSGVMRGAYVDRFKRFGYAVGFAATWTLAGLMALYVSTILNISNSQTDTP
jgi:hypothetical protein